MKWRLDLKKETENIICWTGKQRKIIWLVCVRAVHGLRTAMSPQFVTVSLPGQTRKSTTPRLQL